jgi:diaminopimelate epimerase
MKIPFTKAHGACNDFLLTWRDQAPPEGVDFAAAARAICDRHTGAGADGWLLVSAAGNNHADGSIELWNSDGSRSEISGNGTRCAAAFLIDAGCASDRVSIATGAGLKRLQLLERKGCRFSFEMNMGQARVDELRGMLPIGPDPTEVTILNVGNPQCAVFVDGFEFDWRGLGARIERHPRFPDRTNVSFIRVVDRHTLDVRFFERGAGETMSSGTGSMGAGAAAAARGLVTSPVEVRTPAGPLMLRWEADDILLSGPAEIVARGEFYWNPRDFC